jgi:6-pyruvoyltetrahydropterin/6-carboxytetrahydropterin synthase
MFTITKEFAFEAAHHLPEMPDGHQCKRPHGHSYVVVVELQGYSLDEYGFVEDYGALKDIKEYIDSTLDHRDLTDVFGKSLNTTTAERLAKRMYEIWREKHSYLTAVTVRETAKTSATYRP